jgi:hypothetical protein
MLDNSDDLQQRKIEQHGAGQRLEQKDQASFPSNAKCKEATPIRHTQPHPAYNAKSRPQSPCRFPKASNPSAFNDSTARTTASQFGCF